MTQEVTKPGEKDPPIPEAIQSIMDKLAGFPVAVLRDLVTIMDSGKKTEESRRDFVNLLMAYEYKRGTIVRLAGRAFDAKPSTVDKDIARVKAQRLKDQKSADMPSIRAQSEERMRLIHRKGLEKGDLQASIMASKHLDSVQGVAATEEGERGPIGLLVVPSLSDLDAWQKAAKQARNQKK